MKLSECEIGDVIEDTNRTIEYLGIKNGCGFGRIIKTNVYYESVNEITEGFSLIYNGWVLISKKSKSNTNSEIECLKIQLANIQKQIEKLESENKFEIGSIYEIKWYGTEFKAVLVDIVNDTYKFVSDKNVRYGIHKNIPFTFNKQPDESVKQFFGKKD